MGTVRIAKCRVTAFSEHPVTIAACPVMAFSVYTVTIAGCPVTAFSVYSSTITIDGLTIATTGRECVRV